MKLSLRNSFYCLVQLKTASLVRVTGDVACGPDKPHTISGSSGIITLADASPFFNYESNSDCEWLIEVPDDSKVLN